MKNACLSVTCVAFVLLGTVSAQAATAAPTRPVYTKQLNTPEVSSDTRKLQAILDKDDADLRTADPKPVSPPQTILVMPSAAAAPPTPVQLPREATATEKPAPVATPAQTPAAVPVPREVHDVAPANDPAEMIAAEANGWYQWTKDPTAVFTAAIAFFTFMLALAGGYHVYVAGATARRQLRAYVFITQTEINGASAATQPVSQLVIRNTGQTPAHDVMVYGNMIFDEFPLKRDLPELVFSDPQLTKENLGPGSERYKWEYALVPLNEDQIAKMLAGTHALYVYGEIRYRDVFRKKRFTKYLYYTGGNMGIRGSILGGYPEGNEAI